MDLQPPNSPSLDALFLSSLAKTAASHVVLRTLADYLEKKDPNSKLNKITLHPTALPYGGVSTLRIGFDVSLRERSEPLREKMTDGS